MACAQDRDPLRLGALQSSSQERSCGRRSLLKEAESCPICLSARKRVSRCLTEWAQQVRMLGLAQKDQSIHELRYAAWRPVSKGGQPEKPGPVPAMCDPAQ